jgi:GTP cyclohydrolase II
MDSTNNISIREAKDIPADASLPTEFGKFRIRVFHEQATNLDHVALTLGDMIGPDPVLVRIHSECLTGDAFGSLRCDCGPQLKSAMERIHQAGWGCVVYLRQEGRGIGLREKIKAYHLQDEGVDTLDANLILGHPADARDYRIAAEILKAINITEVSLLTNNPDKVEQMNNLGIEVVEQLPLVVGVGADNVEYLSTKVQRMGHSIDLDSINDIE